MVEKYENFRIVPKTSDCHETSSLTNFLSIDVALSGHIYSTLTASFSGEKAQILFQFDKMKTYDSILRQKYVERLLYFVIQKDNGGFTPDEFAKHLTSNGISPKSIKGRRNPLGKTEPDPRNDFLFTVQKAAQDYGIFFYHHGTRSKKKVLRR